MIKFYDILLLGGLGGSLIISSILFFKKVSNPYLSKLLGAALLLLSTYFLVYELFVTRLILQVPPLHGICIPFYYLIPPISFLYVKGKIRNDSKFKKSDLLHFVLAAFAVVDLMPFYLAGATLWEGNIKAMLEDVRMAHLVKMGFLPSYSHFHLRLLQAFIYLGLQAGFLWKYAEGGGAYPKLGKPAFQWLVSFTVLLSLIYFNLLVLTVQVDAHIVAGRPLKELDSLPITLVSFSFLGIVLSLFYKPEILYGLRSYTEQEFAARISAGSSQLMSGGGKVTEEKLTELSEDGAASFDEETVRYYIAVLEQKIQNEELFREKRINIGTFAAKVEIPPRILSYILNQHYQQRFTDFVNHHRVNYILKRFSDDSWKGLTLEGLASEAGFSSRSTFFAAFKKSTNASPSEYLEKRKSFVSA
ncbi:helix-turn-helix domain-containing protein [Pedobacter sp. SYSU D00535]|uniref:helix-turn-helix domain-containing protein n=1 Tax=Pedobacter sp. SYSU D00535 TaxID=2810308 RepID=UPI001A97AA6F|nr:helix-turn-helix domain-containing protein [Pedobacter sp. SYSU D00535]